MKSLTHHSVCVALLVILGLLILNQPGAAQSDKEKEATTKTPSEKSQQIVQKPGWVTKIFTVKYADVVELSQPLRVFNAQLIPNRDLKVLAVSCDRDTMPAIEDAIKRLDVPPTSAKNIELTVYLLSASEQVEPSSGVTPELQGVVDQLKGLFPYKGFRLTESMVVRVRDGQTGHVSGVAPSTSEGYKIFYNFQFRSANIVDGVEGRTIRIDRLRLGAKVPLVLPGSAEKSLNVQYQDTGIETDIDVRDGKKVVVGKANTDGSSGAMILVVTAKVMD
ncbi:MAG: hypothetical protein LAO21_20210 [Acidobacteriia bacterium]|nr:hypothetical protein [Terriglobia bacterium]